MKKIYLSIALAISFVMSTTAQNKMNTSLSSDEIESLNSTPVKHFNPVASQQKNNLPQYPTPLGCDSMKTLYNAGNGHRGNMFDIVNTNTVAVQITGFDQCFNTTAADSFRVYYMAGTFVGSETNSAAWTYLGAMYMTPTATATPMSVTVPVNVTIPAGATYGFYLTNDLPGTNAYTNGTTLGAIKRQKDGLQFLEGKGGGFFAVTFSPRVWNGNIYYCSPLITGVGSITINEEASEVYPNPMNNEATITISNTIKLNDAALKIVDLAGRVVFSKSGINENAFSLNHNLQSGLYILQVENENKTVMSKKISVQ